MDESASDQGRIGGLANVEMAQAWDEEGARWAAQADRYDAGVRRHSRRLLAAASIGATDRVLDVGCGCGDTTRQAARSAASGLALGVDISKPMIETARRRAEAEGIANVRFELADAQVYPFEDRAFDLVISRFGCMFFADPVAAFRNVGRALRPGGRLALLAWQELRRNEWLVAMREALAPGKTLPEPPIDVPGQFGLASPEHVRRVLGEAGFEEVNLEDVSEPMFFGRDADDALIFGRGTGPVQGMLADVDPPAAERALAGLRSMLAAHETPDGVLLDSRAWLITARRG